MQRTVDILEGRGYRVAFSPNFDARYGYLAGGDAARAADLQWALAADEHAAIFSIHGGYGCARLHPHLDWRALRRARPKVVCGYSDLTALHLMIARELGWVTFHGPNAAGVADRNAFSTGALWRALRPLPLGDVPVDPAHDGIVWRITGGVAEGPLAGGNQHVLSRAIGTPFAPSLSGAIVVLEEVESEPYRLEADLYHLLEAGGLAEAGGIVYTAHEVRSRAMHPTFPHGKSWEEVVAEWLAPLGVPVIANLPLGHGDNLATLPLGVRARLDGDAGTLTVLEPGVEARPAGAAA